MASGIPLGVTMSFLIASPLVNEVAIALLLGLFGIGPTLMYVAAGLVIATVAGYTIGRLKLERWVEAFVFETRLRGQVIDSTAGLTWDDRIQMGVEEVGSIPVSYTHLRLPARHPGAGDLVHRHQHHELPRRRSTPCELRRVDLRGGALSPRAQAIR